MASRAGDDGQFIRNHVGGASSVNRAEVARPAHAAFHDQAVPAVCCEIGNGDASDSDGAHTFFRGYAGVAGESFDLNRDHIAASRADRDAIWLIAVPIETEF